MTRAGVDKVPNRGLSERAPAPRGGSLRAYLRTEIRLSIAINMVLSLVFFLLVFGFALLVPVAGIGGYAVDFIPQSFMIALMSTLMPGIVTAGRIRSERIVGEPQSSAALVRRSALTALGALLFGVVIAALLLVVTADAALPLGWALSAKLLYGGLLAAVVTPIGLRAALRATDLR
jgi:hypothetical protein